MKHLLCVCIAVLAMGTLLVLLIGCGSATALTAIAKDKINQVEQYLNDVTVLERARNQLAEAKMSRADLKKIADQFHIDSEVSLRQIKRIDVEKDKTVEAFKKLQEAAKRAELPKLVDATAEDKAKTIQVGTKNFTGEETYRVLMEYKAQVEKANAAVERERKQSEFLKDRMATIRSQMFHVDSNIAEMERKIADYEMYQKLLTANKKIESLGLSDNKMDELLNTGSMLTELGKRVDAVDVQLGIQDQKNRGEDLKQELNRGASFSITDDDLI